MYLLVLYYYYFDSEVLSCCYLTLAYSFVPRSFSLVLVAAAGAYQGVWISMRSTMRLTLALQTIGPVIWTELGQYCCNAGPQVS